MKSGVLHLFWKPKLVAEFLPNSQRGDGAGVSGKRCEA